MKHLRLAYAGKFARTFNFKNFKNPLVNSLHNWIDNLSMKRLSAKFVHVVTTFAYLVLTFAPTVSFATQTRTVTEELSQDRVPGSQSSPQNLRFTIPNPDRPREQSTSSLPDIVKPTPILRLRGARPAGTGPWGFAGCGMGAWSLSSGPVSIFDQGDDLPVASTQPDRTLSPEPDRSLSPNPENPPSTTKSYFAPTRISVDAYEVNGQLAYKVRGNHGFHLDVTLSNQSSPQAIAALGFVPITNNDRAVGFVHQIRDATYTTVLFANGDNPLQVNFEGITPESRLESLTLNGQGQYLLQNLHVNTLVQNTNQVCIGENASIQTMENITAPGAQSFLGLLQGADFQGHVTGTPYQLIQTEGNFRPQGIANFNQTQLEVMPEGRAEIQGNTFGGNIINLGEVCLNSLQSIWGNIKNAGKLIIAQGRHMVKELANQVDEIKGNIASNDGEKLKLIQNPQYVKALRPDLMNRGLSFRDVAIEGFMNYFQQSEEGGKYLSFLSLYLSLRHRDIYKRICEINPNFFPVHDIFAVDRSNIMVRPPEGKYDQGSTVPLEELLFEREPEQIMEMIFCSDQARREMLRGKIWAVILVGWPEIMQRLEDFTGKWFGNLDIQNRNSNKERSEAKAFYESVKERIYGTIHSFFGHLDQAPEHPNLVVGDVVNWGQIQAPEIQFDGPQVPEGMQVVGNLNLDARGLGLRSLNQLRSIGVRGLLNVAVGDWHEQENVELPGVRTLGVQGSSVQFHRDLSVPGLYIDVAGHAGFGESNTQMSRVRIALPEGMASLDPQDYIGRLHIQSGDADFRYAQVTVDRDAYVKAHLNNILLGSSTSHGGSWTTKTHDNYELGFTCLGGTENHRVTTNCLFYRANNSYFRAGATITLEALKAILLEGADVGSRLQMTFRAGESIQAKFSNIQGLAGGEMTAPRVALERHAALRQTGLRLSSKYKDLTRDLIRSEETKVNFMDDLRVNSQTFRLWASHIQTGGSFVHNGQERQEGQMGASVERMKYGAAECASYLPASIRVGQQIQLNNNHWNINGDLSGQQFRADVESAAFRNSTGRQPLRDRRPQTLSISEIMRTNPTSIMARNLEKDGEGNYINPIPGGHGFHPNLRQCLVLEPNFDPITHRPRNPFMNLDMESIVSSLFVQKTGRGYIKLEDGTSVAGVELLQHLMNAGKTFEREFFEKHKRQPMEADVHGYLSSMVYFLIDENNQLLPMLHIAPHDMDKYSQGAGEFQDSVVKTQGDMTQQNFALIGHERILNQVGGSQFLLSQAIREHQHNGFQDHLYARAMQEGGTILNQVAGRQIREGAVLHAQGSLRNEAGQGIYDFVARVLSHHESGSKRRRTIEDTNRPMPSSLTSETGRVQDIAHQGNVMHEATIVRGQGIDIVVPEGQFERRVAMLHREIHVRFQKKNALRTKTGGHGEMSQTAVQSHLDPGVGGLNIFAQNIYAELRPGEQEDCFTEVLKDYPNADIKTIRDAYHNYKLKTQRTLSPYVVSLIAIGIAIATQGMGLGQALANKLFTEVATQVATQAATQATTQVATQITAQAIAHAAVTGAVNAAISNVLTQFTVGTIQNKGRLGQTFKDVFSEEGLKSIGQSAATAAFAAALIRGFDLKVPQSLGKGETMSYMDRLKLASVNFTASSTMGIAFGGRPQDVLLANLRGGAADFLQAIMAEKVGQFFKEEEAAKASQSSQGTPSAQGSPASPSEASNPSAQGASGGTGTTPPTPAPEFSFIEQFPRYLVHGGIGAMVGQISSSESASRAVGAVTGEFVGDVYRHMFSDPWDFHPDNPHRQANVERALTYIEIAATLTAATFNLDVNEVKASAVIAARENVFALLAIPYAITTAKIMWEIYSLVYEEEVNQAKEDIAREIARRLDVKPETVLMVMEAFMTCTSLAQMLKKMGKSGFKLLLEKGLHHAIKNGVGNLEDFLQSISNNMQKNMSKSGGSRPSSHEPSKPPKAPGKGGKSGGKKDKQNPGQGDKPSMKSLIKKEQLPTQGKVRFVPPKNHHTTQPLPKGPNGGYYDKFNNEWKKGESRTKGDNFEWDVILSRTGRKHFGWATRDGSHLNVSPKGRITHK